jgi:hypothetical protein
MTKFPQTLITSDNTHFYFISYDNASNKANYTALDELHQTSMTVTNLVDDTFVGCTDPKGLENGICLEEDIHYFEWSEDTTAYEIIEQF